MQTIRPKNVAPSISAAEMIIAVWMLPATSGCRAMLSTAQRADLADAESGADDDQAGPEAPPKKIENRSLPTISWA